MQDRRYHPRPLRYLLLVLQININTQDHLYINYIHTIVPYAKLRYRVLAVRRDIDSSVSSHLFFLRALVTHDRCSTLTRTLLENRSFFSPFVFVVRTRKKKRNAEGSRELFIQSIRIRLKILASNSKELFRTRVRSAVDRLLSFAIASIVLHTMCVVSLS